MTVTTTVVGEGLKSSSSTSSVVESFAYVIICTGLFSNAPNIIDIPGAKAFVEQGKGRVLHTSEWKSVDEFHDQNVLIIGNGKSAADAASAAAIIMAKRSVSQWNDTHRKSSPSSVEVSSYSEAAAAAKTAVALSSVGQKRINPPLQCIRKQTWYVPQAIYRYKFLFHSRLVSGLLPPYYYCEGTSSSFVSLLRFIFHPIKYVLWRILEVVFLLLLRLPYKVWPRFNTIDRENTLSASVLVANESYLRQIRTGEIDLRIAQVTQLYASKHAQLSSGDIVPVDVVVLGTGWKVDYSFFNADSVQSKLQIEHDGLWLYRNILPPDLPGLAFIGANTETFMNIYTSYIQAYWLVHLMTGQRAAVSTVDMFHCLEGERSFKRKQFPYSCIRGATIAAYMQQYHDVLLIELGMNPYVYKGLLAPIYNLVWPMLPETVSSSFDMIRSTFSNQFQGKNALQ
jgi:dimethylaniline monooxygenase (N-oxide forming)